MPAVSPTILAAVRAPAAADREQRGRERRMTRSPISRSSARIAHRQLRGSARASSRAMPRDRGPRDCSSDAGQPLEGADALEALPAQARSAGSRSCRCQRRRLLDAGALGQTRSVRWSVSRRSSRSGPSRRASGRPGSRRAARATAAGVDRVALAGACGRCLRTPAMSFGGTRTQTSPRSRRRGRSRRPET